MHSEFVFDIDHIVFILSSILSGRPRPTDFRNSGSSSNEPLSRKKRQDSYLKAVGGLSPDESESESGKQETRTNGGSTTRAWKIRQDSYQQAVEGGELVLLYFLFLAKVFLQTY